MLPFGQTVYLWRLERGLTQDKLARRAGMSRPNLSAVEKGRREVTLSTLRALAAALKVKPGTLADGTGPRGGADGGPLSREALERIAAAVGAGRTAALSGRERELGEEISQIVRNRLSALGGKPLPPGKRARPAADAWLKARAQFPPAVLQSLVQRIAERAELP